MAEILNGDQGFANGRAGFIVAFRRHADGFGNGPAIERCRGLQSQGKHFLVLNGAEHIEFDTVKAD